MSRSDIICPMGLLPYNGDPPSLGKVLPLMYKILFCKSIVHSIQSECHTYHKADSLYIRGIGFLVRYFFSMDPHVHAWRMCGLCCSAASQLLRVPRLLKLPPTHAFKFRSVGKFLEPIFNINFLLFFLGVPSREKLVQTRRFAPSTQIITSQHKGL